jgi:hypothetical protein
MHKGDGPELPYQGSRHSIERCAFRTRLFALGRATKAHQRGSIASCGAIAASLMAVLAVVVLDNPRPYFDADQNADGAEKCQHSQLTQPKPGHGGSVLSLEIIFIGLPAGVSG